MPKIKINDLSVTYAVKKKPIPALKNISFELDDGDTVAVFGETGSGKTSLFRAVSNVLEYDGEILIDGVDSREIKNFRNMLSYVSQEFDLYKKMTVYENLEFPLLSLKIPKDEIDNRILDVAAMFNLTYLLTRLPKQLSIGQKQKVYLGKSLIKVPSILLLDECFSSSDEQFKEEFIPTLKKIIDINNITTFYASHKIEDALMICNKYLVLEEGELAFFGTKEEFLKTEFYLNIVKH